MPHFIYCYAEHHSAKCRYAECLYAECRGAKISVLPTNRQQNNINMHFFVNNDKLWVIIYIFKKIKHDILLPGMAVKTFLNLFLSNFAALTRCLYYKTFYGGNCCRIIIS
jgi:hypothetical protein